MGVVDLATERARRRPMNDNAVAAPANRWLFTGSFYVGEPGEPLFEVVDHSRAPEGAFEDADALRENADCLSRVVAVMRDNAEELDPEWGPVLAVVHIHTGGARAVFMDDALADASSGTVDSSVAAVRHLMTQAWEGQHGKPPETPPDVA